MITTFFRNILSLFKGLIWLLRTAMRMVSNLILLLFAFGILALCVSFFYQPEIPVPENALLYLNLKGDVVETRSAIDPITHVINKVSGIPLDEEVVLHDLLDTLYAASSDPRIKTILIDPDELKKVGYNQLLSIGNALEICKNSGKKIIATGINFSQQHYYLASWADEIYIHPMGGIQLQGFGVFRLYLKKMLEKLNVETHVFQVGTFKSATEPLTRQSMSESAKKANMAWLQNLWDRYSTNIAENRKLDKDSLDIYLQSLNKQFRKANGNRAQMALNNGLVDGIETKTHVLNRLKNDKDTPLQRISWQQYLGTVTPSYTKPKQNRGLVGIIRASGTIVSGEGDMEQIGSTVLINKLRKARYDRRIAAVVLRLDTGGGSALASELIRQEIIRLRKAGKPVVVSMGRVAASGGYWLSADASAIVASPMTLTGSIGVFGVVPNFHKTIQQMGMSGDGIGTTPLATTLSNPFSPMTKQEQEMHQLDVAAVYSTFINLVAKGRKMQRQVVEQLAEGRVWDGATALDLGLVDELGDMDRAVLIAGKLINTEDADAIWLDTPAIDFFSTLQESPFIQALVLAWQNGLFSFFTGAGTSQALLPQTEQGSMQQVREALEPMRFLLEGADPRHIYAHSLLFADDMYQ